MKLDVQPDGYVSVLVDSPAISQLDPVGPQPQDDGLVQLSLAASDSPTSVLNSSKHGFGDEEEPCCAEVCGRKECTTVPS
jgi:hypothetical protein